MTNAEERQSGRKHGSGADDASTIATEFDGYESTREYARPPRQRGSSPEMVLEEEPAGADGHSCLGLEVTTGSSDENVQATKSPLYQKPSGSVEFPQEDPASPWRLQCLVGMRQDLAARLPFYPSDWGRPRSIMTIVNASVYAFVIQLIPALIFAEIMNQATQGNLSTAETLLSTGVLGCVYTLLAGQPLCLLGVTGLIAILVDTSYSLADKFQAEYFSFYFWTCIWGGLFHVVSAMVGVVDLVWKVTPFTTQIFELFTAVVFIQLSLQNLLGPILAPVTEQVDAAQRYAELSIQYASLFLGLLTMYIAWVLHFAEQWTCLTRIWRIFLARYNTFLAIAIVTALSYVPALNQADNVGGGLDRVAIRFPWDWQPTADRNWLPHPIQNITVGGIFAAMIPGFMFFLLFFIDHNVSSILSQTSNYNLKKPPAYHWDYFVLGLTFVPCALLGIPPACGLLPQAPLHTRSLCTREYYVDEYNVKRERVVHCEEQRWSAMAQSLLMFVALAAFRVISWIPRGALFGLLLYLGMGALHGNEVWERILMQFMRPKRRPLIPVVRNVEWRVVQYWTLVQTLCTLVIWVVATFLRSIGYLYPIFLFLLVPLRALVLERLFSKRDMAYLDPFDGEAAETTYHEEQKVFHAGRPRGDSYDSEEMDFPTRAEFRGQGRRRLGKVQNRVRRHSLGDSDLEGVIPHDSSKPEHSMIRVKSVDELVRAAQAKFEKS